MEDQERRTNGGAERSGGWRRYFSLGQKRAKWRAAVQHSRSSGIVGTRRKVIDDSDAEFFRAKRLTAMSVHEEP